MKSRAARGEVVIKSVANLLHNETGKDLSAFQAQLRLKSSQHLFIY